MPKIEIPGLNPKGHVHTESPEAPEAGATAEEAKPPAQEPAASESPQGVPLEGDLDPVLAEAVSSQPLIPRPEVEPEPAPLDVEERVPSLPPRPRALGGLVVAGALALAGAVWTVALGGKNGRANQNPGEPTAGAGFGAASAGLGGGFLDPGELELARYFGSG